MNENGINELTQNLISMNTCKSKSISTILISGTELNCGSSGAKTNTRGLKEIESPRSAKTNCCTEGACSCSICKHKCRSIVRTAGKVTFDTSSESSASNTIASCNSTCVCLPVSDNINKTSCYGARVTCSDREAINTNTTGHGVSGNTTSNGDRYIGRTNCIVAIEVKIELGL